MPKPKSQSHSGPSDHETALKLLLDRAREATANDPRKAAMILKSWIQSPANSKPHLQKKRSA